jgi:hypothetical protein
LTVFKPKLLLQYRLAGDIHSKLLEDLLIHITQHHGAMSLTATELWQLLQSFLAFFVFFLVSSAWQKQLQKEFILMP